MSGPDPWLRALAPFRPLVGAACATVGLCLCLATAVQSAKVWTWLQREVVDPWIAAGGGYGPEAGFLVPLASLLFVLGVPVAVGRIVWDASWLLMDRLRETSGR